MNVLVYTRWWFRMFFIFTPIWGRFPFWLIFFRWVGSTTNQIYVWPKHFQVGGKNLLRGFVSELTKPSGGKRVTEKAPKMTDNDFCLKIIFVDHILTNQKALWDTLWNNYKTCLFMHIFSFVALFFWFIIIEVENGSLFMGIQGAHRKSHSPQFSAMTIYGMMLVEKPWA